MVVGDIINGVSADNTILTHQPAAGVEEMVTAAFMDAFPTEALLTDGVVFSSLVSDGLLGRRVDQSNMKMGITNTLFFAIGALGVGRISGFTAIQTQ